MPLPASLEGPHPSAHTQKAQLRKHLFQINTGNSYGCFRKHAGVACSSRPTSHTLVHSLLVRAPYSSGASDPGYSSGVPSASSTPFAGQTEQRQPGFNAGPENDQQERSGSPSGIVSLMQAWGQLSTRLQAPPAAGSVASADSNDDAVTQLILSALKLAVRSLSRVPAVGAGDSNSPASSTSSNKPAVQRSLALAAALAELYANGLPVDAASIAAGIVAEAVDVAALHIRTVQAKLGQEVAGLVQDVLAVRHAPDRLQVLDDPSSSALRGWLLTAYDVRACAIEVVWRCMALVQPPTQLYQQQLLAMEALTVYCPLGHALGLGVCSATLEDAAFKVLFPSSYASTARHVLPMSGAAAELLARCQATLQEAANTDAAFQKLSGGLQLLSRTKSLYSIMKKLLRLNDPAAGSRRLGQMYDLLGMRAVVLPRRDLPRREAEAAAVQACYRLQELAHEQWPPVHGRSKDYIAKPKPNGYQSLHSTLSMEQMQQQHSSSSSSSGGGGSVVLSYLELQIRTAAMHAAAEGGDAAHAGYKGRLEKRQVRHLQAWTAQLQRRLGAPQQQLLLTLPSSSSGSGAGGAVLQPTQPVATFATSSEDSDTESSSATDITAAASAAAEQQQQQMEQQPAAAAAAAASLFRHLDLDGDGMLSLYELTELLSELGELKQQAVAGSRSGWSSGTPAAAAAAGPTGTPFMPVSTPAAAAVMTPAAYAQQVFEMLDSNSDGLISMAEFLDFYLSNTTCTQAAADASGTSKAGLASYLSSSSSSNNVGSDSSALGSTRNSSSSSMLLDQPLGGIGRSNAGNSSGSSTTPTASASSGAIYQVFMHTSLPAAPTNAATGVRAGSSSSSSSRYQYLRPPGVATPKSLPSSSSSSNSSVIARSSSSRRRSSCKCMANSQARAAAAAVAASDAAAYGSSSSSGSSKGNGNGLADQGINGSGNNSMDISNGNGAGLAAAGSPGQQQQQQQRVFRPPTWRQAQSSTGAEQGQQVVAAAFGFTAQQEEPEQQQQQQQQIEQQHSSSQQQDSGEGVTYQQQQRQQLEAELSYEEDEQQQRRFLRQQQRQLPSLLEDAAAGRSPCYVLLPVSVQQRSNSSSTNGSSSSSSDGEDGRMPDAPAAAAAAAAPVITDWLGRQLHEIEVPCLGPLLITNAPQVFKSSDVLIDAPTEHYDRLAVTLELVKPTGSSEPVLQARNISRVVRSRLDAAAIKVNYGLTVLQPHRAAVQLLHGDVIELGETGAAFVVQQVAQQATSPAVLAVQQVCGVYAEQQLGLKLPIQQALDSLQQQQQRQQRHVEAPKQQQQQLSPAGVGPSSSSSSSSTQQGWNTSAADAIESQLRQISRVVRSDARAAEIELCQLAAAHPDAPGPWFLLAQLAASSRRPWMARQLFRAAAVCQQQQLEQVMRGGAAAEAAAALPGQQQQQEQQEGTEGPAAAAVEPPSTSSSSTALNTAPSSSNSSRRRRRGEDGSNHRSPAFRLSSRLVQVLRVWARSEWDQRLFGPARRLWRLAANEAFKFPYDIAAEGGGAVLHAWATAEFGRDNVLNARVVIGEALRKCPKDAAVAVLAGSIEASAGEYSAARALFLRAYQLNKADKQLYMQWPRMEGAVGNIDRARLLFQYGLSLYPSNIKILNLYACFEEQQGNVELAREMHQRALGIDNASLTSMHNRVSWAELELQEGNVEEARELLREGLDAHPDFPAALLLYARLERQAGQLDVAEAYARRAQKASHAFAPAAMSELAAVYAARGESGLAANLKRHIANMNDMQGTKQAGKLHGSRAWIGFHMQNAQPEQRQVIEGAWQRKKELGLIRQGRGRGRGGRQQQQQQHEWQQQESVNGALELKVDSVVESFDFAAAAAAAAAAAEQQRQQGQRRR